MKGTFGLERGGRTRSWKLHLQPREAGLEADGHRFIAGQAVRRFRRMSLVDG